MIDELELRIFDRLRTLLRFDARVIALPSVSLPIRQATPLGVAQGDGLVLALDLAGGEQESATTGDAPRAGKDNLTFYFYLSATLAIPERSGGDPDAAQVEAKRAIANACGVLRRVLRTYVSDVRLDSDPADSLPLWHKTELHRPGWDYPEAQGQAKTGRIFLRVHTQQRRG